MSTRGIGIAASSADSKMAAAAFERAFPATVAAVLCAAFAVSVYAAFAWRSLDADAVNYFMTLLVTHDFALFEPARRTVHVLQQLPTVIALRLGVSDLTGLADLYGLTLQLLPLGLTAACYPLLPRADKPLFVFPLAHYLLGTMASSFAPIVEAPVGAAYFWVLLFLILFARRPVVLAATVALALPALYLHETTVVLMPILAGASGLRAYSEEESPARRYLFFLLVPWFVAITVVQAGLILYPRSLVGRQHALLNYQFLFGIGRIGWGWNVPAELGILAVLAGARACWPGIGPRRGMRAVLLFGAISIVLLAVTAATGVNSRLFLPALQFTARYLAVIVSAPLAVLLIVVRRRPASRAIWMRPPITLLLLFLVLGQVAWHALGIHYWSLYMDDVRSLLASHRGYLPWREALADATPEQAARLRRFSWGWTNPQLSIVLAPEGRVATVIGPYDAHNWQPFDPTQPDQLPRAPQFDYAAYVQALAANPPTLSSDR